MMKKILLALIISALSFTLLYNCSPSRGIEITEGGVLINYSYETDNELTYELMRDIYLWSDEISELPRDINSYDDPDELIYNLIPERDIWSSATALEDFPMGKYDDENPTEESFGFYAEFLPFSENRDEVHYRIISIREECSLYSQGVRTGDRILQINNTKYTGLTEELISWDMYIENIVFPREIIVETLSGRVKASLKLSTYPHRTLYGAQIINQEGQNTGYFSLQEFSDVTESELMECFQEFAEAGIEEIVVDLRNNSGGLSVVSHFLINLLIGDTARGGLAFTEKFNSLYSHLNTEYFIEDMGFDFSFKRVFFLTNSYTASASEAVIISLKPYVDVIVVGMKTFGKPVGTFTIFDDNYIFFPVAFEIVNSRGEGEYFDGLNPDYFVFDNGSYDFADSEDPLMKKVLEVIEESN